MREVEREALSPPRPAQQSGGTTPSLSRVVFLLVFPGLVAVMAFMPVVTLGPMAFAIRSDFDLTVAHIGFAYTAYFLASSVLTSVGGWLISRFSTLVIVRIGLVCSAVLAAAMAFAGSAVHIVLLSIVAGTVNGLVTPSINVLITRLVPVHLRGLAFGIKAGAVPSAAALAALGAFAAASLQTPWQLLYWVCAGLGCTVFGLTTLLRSGDGGEPPARSAHRAASRVNSRGSLVLLSIGGLLGASGTAVLPPFIVDGLIHHNLEPGAAAGVLALSSCLGIVSRIVAGGLSDRWPAPLSHLVAVISMMLVAAASMAVLAFGAGEFLLIGATIAVFMIGWAWPGLIHYAVIATHADRPAVATSYMQSGTYLGSVLGPLGFGLLAHYVSFAAAWGVAGITVLTATLFLTVGVRRLRRSQPLPGAGRS
jgi:MFS family permease